MRRPLVAAVAAVAVVAAAAAVLALPTEDAPPPRSELAAVIDGLVTGSDRVAPGATAYVAGPRGTWSGAAGLADVAAETVMEPDARMRLESVSKIWTAAIVLHLAEGGRLSPADTVEEWLPGLLPYGEQVTIAQLLAHRSGLIDNNDMASDSGRFIARVADAALRARLTEAAERVEQHPETEFPPLLWVRLAAAQPLLFEPGSDTHYSNIGFEILGLVAERASGRTLPELYDELFERAGVVRATYDPQGPIEGDHAHGYLVDDDGSLTDATAWHAGIGAEGGVVADADETARFLTELMRGRLLAARWVDGMRGDLFWSGGEPSGCGTGYGHAGGGPGYSTQVRVSADGSRVAVLLLNGRRSPRADERAERAIWQLFCAA